MRKLNVDKTSEDVFRKSFDRLTNFQFMPCIHGSLHPVSMELLLLCYSLP